MLAAIFASFFLSILAAFLGINCSKALIAFFVASALVVLIVVIWEKWRDRE